MEHSEHPVGHTISRLTVKRTYGRPRQIPSSPDPTHGLLTRWDQLSSSPITSSLVLTPSSSPPMKRARLEFQPKDMRLGVAWQASPRETAQADAAEDKENILAGINAVATSSKSATKQGSLKSFFTPLPKTLPLLPTRAISRLPVAGAISASEAGRTAPIISLQQSHLTHLPLLQSCKTCSMTYVRGGDDEGVHARHHVRVMRGIPWEGLGRGWGNRKAEKDKGWREVEEVQFGLKGKGQGRVLVCDGSWGGAKLEEILQTVDLSLSSPALPPAILERCKIFLLVTASPPPPPASGKVRPAPATSTSGRSSSAERIVSVVVAQGIKWAIRVLLDNAAGTGDGKRAVDSGGGVMCDPTPLDTPLGIHRLYTIPSYRSLGLALTLLEATRDHTVYGCSFDPKKGQIAFSQPTESGRAVMERWGRGAVRVFVDDERQI